MKVWFDFANSPHVPFFKPIITSLKNAGNHEIVITLRDFSQTVPLAKKYNLDGTLLGKHGGRSRFAKMNNLVNRSLSLYSFARGMGIERAVSHNSYTQVIAGKLSGIRTITIMDYEGQPANHLAFRFADKVIVPSYFPDTALRKFGARSRKVYKYDGFKEQLYLSDFECDPGFIGELAESCRLPEDLTLKDKVLVTVRPPALMALYHRFGNPLFVRLLDRLNSDPDLTVILLPRTQKQQEELHLLYPNFFVPEKPLDGSNLIYHSDLVISAGGYYEQGSSNNGNPCLYNLCGRTPGGRSAAY